MAEFRYLEPFPLAKDEAPFRKLASDHVSIGAFEGQEVLKVAREAFRDVAFLYRPGHLAQLEDPEASDNDRGGRLPAGGRGFPGGDPRGRQGQRLLPGARLIAAATSP